MILGIVKSIQIGRSQRYDGDGLSGQPWTSAICKRPVGGRVDVRSTNIVGDEQADLKHHGGPDKAVLAYAAEHYPAWNAEFPKQTFDAGGFGENLTVAGFAESDCCIGDIMQIGDCQLQISQPRQPCWKLSRRWKLPKLAVIVQQTGRTGWYYRVLCEGTIAAGMPITLIERPFPDFTVAWASSVMYAQPRHPQNDSRLAACVALSRSWQDTLNLRATKGIERDSSLRLIGPREVPNPTTKSNSE